MNFNRIKVIIKYRNLYAVVNIRKLLSILEILVYLTVINKNKTSAIHRQDHEKIILSFISM